MNLHFQINSNDLILIILSIALPFILNWKEELDRNIDKFIFHIRRYLNVAEINKRENYFKLLRLSTSDKKEIIKFFTENIKIEDNNPLLLPGRSGTENDWLRDCQQKLKELSNRRMVLNFFKYAIPITIIIFLLFTS